VALGVRLNPWGAFTAGLALLALAAIALPSGLIDWQPALAASQPWRAFSAAFVHWSMLHLGANLAGAVVVALFGWAARLPPAATLAWIVAWPLTHVALALRPELAHYGGLSGVLHAGVAVAATWLALEAGGRRRAVAFAVLAGLGLKVVLEAPWGPVLRHNPGWDIAIAPLAHASGAVAGMLCALCVRAAGLRRKRRLGSPP
jgi:rhomboid family GlyGly-CTERM serine protease